MQGRLLGTLPFAAARRALPIVLVVLALHAAASGYPQHRDSYLNDFANVVRPEDATQLRAVLTELRDTTGIEAVVVTVNSVKDYGTGDTTIESFATGLFNAWGVGNNERNDGAMLLVAVKDRTVRIEVGAGFGTKLNAPTKRIVDSQLVPSFKRGDYSGGIVQGARALRQELERWKPAAEADDTAIAATAPQPAIGSLQAQRANAEQRGVRRSLDHALSNPSSAESNALNIIITIVTGGVGAGIAGFALTRTKKCPNCKTKLVLLDPARDHERLDDGQEREEKLNSVDYQFFRCPQCGHEDMQKKRRLFSEYSACPHCSYRTMKQSQHVVAQATRNSTGTKLVTQTCQHCSYRHEQTVVLPILPDTNSTYRGRSGGGGSFGGGRSSGGGSSGSW